MTSQRSKQFLLKTLGQRIKKLRKEKNMSQSININLMKASLLSMPTIRLTRIRLQHPY